MSRPVPLGRWSGWAALAWAGAFLYLGVTPSPPVVPGLDFLGWVGHAGASALLGILVADWLLVRRSAGRLPALGGGLVIAWLLGAIIEVLQLGSDARAFEVADLVADGVGAAAGVWLHWFLSGRVRRGALSAWVVAAGLASAALVGLSAVVT